MGTLSTAVRIATGRAAPPPTTTTQAPAPEQRATVQLGTFGQGLSGLTAGGAVLEVAAAERDYSASAVAYRCVAFIANNLATVDLMVMAGDEPDDRDPIAQLWNKGTPGAAYSAVVVKQVMYARAELTGEAFAYLDRGDTGTGPVGGVHPIYDPVEVKVAKVEGGRGRLVEQVVGYVVRHHSGELVPLLPSEVLWLRYPHPTQRWGALAPWKAALYANETDAYARAWQRGEFQNGARPSSIIYLGALDERAHNSTVAAYNSKVAGPGNAGKSLLVSGPTPAQATHLGLTPAEMSYLETRAASAHEVMLAFGLRPDLFEGQSTYENQRAAKTAAWSEVLLAKLDVMAGELDRQLMPEPTRTVAWDLSNVDALRENEDALVKRADLLARADIVTLDEARAPLGLDPLPGGLGAYTRSAYLERVRLQAQVDYLPQLTGGAGDLRAAPPRMIRHRNTTRLVRRQAAQQRAAQTVTSVHNAYARHERIGVRALERLAERQVKDVLRRLRDLTRESNRAETLQRWATYAATQPATMPYPGGPEGATLTHDTGQRMAADDLFSLAFWVPATRDALEGFLTGAWSEGGERAASSFGLSWDTFDRQVLAEMDDRLRVLAGQVSDTTRAVIDAQLLANGVEAGEGIDELADRLRAVFTDLSTWRAELIARTETVGGFNAAAHRVAADSGLVVTREWLATSDARTRPSHQRQNGHRLAGTAGTYPNGCRYPGDPYAPASETVACRCVELFDTES